ncbi:AtzE family amidohydrolase [Plastoroseomonas arctica]|uniref:AtzE family amidohydrolase n=1 Tax=Plastoroseomonas arctica TaxID=1509237 RepID=A0AAF1K7V8_9PROT|nr:AtzE family amidohydrolase [Plastoroseomonas arctica]
MTSAATIARAVRAGETTAAAVAEAALSTIAARDPALNAFTTITADRARAEAAAVDAAIAQGRDPGPLAGVPVAVKNLFDLTGIVTVAGSKIDRDRAPAKADAYLVRRMQEAGAIMCGALNMDEYAYGFTTENAHDGPCHNPHDLTRIAGGSSGGSAAAVAGGLVPITLGSDTNGSIRVPSSLCGIWGVKPTYGRLSRGGSTMFAASFDHLGPFARTLEDLALVYDVLQGRDADDPPQTWHGLAPVLPGLEGGIAGLRIAVADGHFAEGGHPEAFAAVALVAEALGVGARVTLPDAALGRAAAFLITMCEGANLHMENLRTRAADFDPGTRDRFLAGALLPAHWLSQAQRMRQAYREGVARVFEEVDVILAPATPFSATKIGQAMVSIDGVEMPVRPNLGVFTQPISCIGLPVVCAPLAEPARAGTPGGLPIGVQIIAAPWREDLCFRVARALEAAGICAAPPVKGDVA